MTAAPAPRRAIPGLFKWTNYDSTMGGGSLSACLPACYIFLPFFAEFAQNFVKKCRNFWKYTELRQLSLLFVRYVRKAPNWGLAGNYLGFPRISAKVAKFRRKLFDLSQGSAKFAKIRRFARINSNNNAKIKK